MKFNNAISEKIWEDRYRKNDETLDENLRRVAKYCATNEDEYEIFYDVMNKGLFFPAGRTMSNSGIGKNLTLNNCFTAPQVKDDTDDIFDKVKLGACTHRKGGGIGYDFSKIRPKGSPTSNDAIASGAVSFMDVFNAQTATILQGNRRGANMGVMNIYSMDIEDFIKSKSKNANKLNHFNISVMVDDDFMIAVKYDKNINLHYPVYDENGCIIKDENKWIYKKEVSAKYLWDLVMRNAYENGEPGVFFYDTLNRDNNLQYIERITCTNPCGEYLAGTVYGNNPKTGKKLNSNDFGGACNLGSLFLHNFVENPFTKNAKFNYETLKNTIDISIRFLDNIIDINNYPNEIYENYQKSFRTIGLGVTGLADMLTMMGLKYNTREAISFVDNLMEFIAYYAYNASIDLAIAKGEFQFLDREKFVSGEFICKHLLSDAHDWENIREGILKYGIRNAKILSVAPTGTLSLTYGNNCSSGIEPIFSLTYDRKIKVGGQNEDNIETVTLKDYSYNLWEETKENNVVDKDVFITATEMSVDDHINMLSAIAFHVDMGVSKTINVPPDYSFEDTQNIYMRCWENGIKGCTIFRPNNIRQGILMSSKENKKEGNIDLQKKEDNCGLKRGYVIQVNDDVIGKKRKLITGCGSLHCTAFFDPINGELLETYLSKGSTGGCNNFMIGLSRMISYSSRLGGNIYDIIDQLNSCGTCPSYAVRKATKGDVSKGSCCPIAVGNALLEMHNEIQEELNITNDKADISEDVVEENNNIKSSEVKCPECGDNLTYEGGCIQCKSCGWSKCE